MARRTSPKTAAANRRFAKTQPLRTYQTKGGAQQYGSFEEFNRQDRLAFDRLMKALDPNDPIHDHVDRGSYLRSLDRALKMETGMIPREKNYISNKLDKLSAIQNSMRAGVSSAPRPYGGQLSEELERSDMEAARKAFSRSKFKGTF